MGTGADMGLVRTREDFDRYQAAFHAGDYDTAFDYYVEKLRLRVFGLEITTRFQLHKLYRFLHEHVRETIHIERFAISEDFVAAEALVRIEGLRDVDTQRLREEGLHQFGPIAAGEVQ